LSETGKGMNSKALMFKYIEYIEFAIFIPLWVKVQGAELISRNQRVII
jgi:hypothetical protein